jgi:predicted site-specific integrase-resolvase
VGYINTRNAVKSLGLSPNTLRKYADAGIIETIRTPGNRRLYNIDGYLKRTSTSTVICYCRVSSKKQADDLERQLERMQSIYPQAEIVKDIGSGLNFKRKGLRAILERLLRGDKLKVVVANRDRIARFGFDLFKFLIEKNGGELVVQRESVGSDEEEMCEDILAVLHHFSCKMHGKRSHSGTKDKALSNQRAREIVQEMVGSEPVFIQPSS